MATTTSTRAFLDIEQLEQFIVAAVNQYEVSAPTVYAYLNGLYGRLMEDTAHVALAELLSINGLLENGIWEHPNFAANRIYHLMDRLGQDTTGQLGF